MEDEQVLYVLKSAILLEKRGQAFYNQVAASTKGVAVKSFFEQMTDEEKQHEHVLTRHYTSYCEDAVFAPDVFSPGDNSVFAAAVLTESLKKEIAAAGYEAAAISAAISMEKDAMKLYADRAKKATDQKEKELYQWLAKWEGDHFKALVDLEKEITQQIWTDNNFWSF